MGKLAKKTKLKRGRSALPYYRFDEFNQATWREINDLTSALWPAGRRSMTRPQWLSIGQMLLGKAELIDRGSYRLSKDEAERARCLDWATRLRRIAAVIHDRFKPGDEKY